MKMEEEEPTGYINFEKFNKVAMNILMGGSHIRNDEEQLYRAFLVCNFFFFFNKK